jgi:hypothetical protein
MGAARRAIQANNIDLMTKLGKFRREGYHHSHRTAAFQAVAHLSNSHRFPDPSPIELTLDLVREDHPFRYCSLPNR